jgi:hypothetical protein
MWGSQSWLQPAFSRPLPRAKARPRPEKSRLKAKFKAAQKAHLVMMLVVKGLYLW